MSAESIDYGTIWFILLGVLFTGYAILDGFDLGVGALHLFTKTDEERRVMINAIGPVWDGNEVWLVTGGGALFAAFPAVYATVFSGFYLPLILVLFALILRATAIECRSKQPMAWWRRTWDRVFGISSIVASLLFGVALGNVARGIPLDVHQDFTGTFWSLLNPYSLLIGVTTVALFMMHGANYALLKTDGPLNEKIRRWMKLCTAFFIVCYVASTIATLATQPHLVARLKASPWLFVFAIIAIFAIANIPWQIHKRREWRAFLSSCVAIMALMTLLCLGMYPNLVLNTTGESLTVANASSSTKTLQVMLIIAAIGMPLVLAYTTMIYWIFRGKVKMDRTSY